MKPFWSKDVGPWVARQLDYGGPFEPGTCVSMGVQHQGRMAAGVVFHNYEEEAQIMEVSAASVHPGWATRRVLNELASYAYDCVGVQMLFARQSLHNMPARKLWTKLGAFECTIPRLFGRGTVGTVLFLTDDAWRSSKFYREDYVNGWQEWVVQSPEGS